jgi:hypothetical protein
VGPWGEDLHGAMAILATIYKNNKIGKVYSLEHTEIPKVFFTPHHVGCCCTDVI